MSEDPRRTMRDFWDAKARENAMYYISSYRPYDRQDADEFWGWGEKLTERYLAESGIPFTGRERVLEIGCGIGRMTRALAARFAAVVATDVSEEMVRQAREHLSGRPNVEVRIGSGVDLAEFPDASFDFVFSYLVFQHIPDPEVTRRYLREAARVLAPAGWFLFQINGETKDATAHRHGLVAARRWVARGAGALRRALKSGARRGPTGLDSPAWRGSRLPLAEARATCEAAELEVVRTHGEGTQYLWIAARKPDRV
ncbi:MAG TPA: class I SAM-dependent methyltransferase [Candidatus Limnocylindria bacterium]|nr:class I SAM-dependent methyltransferase [Candidatus Limnocylindria bacterium]